MSHECVLIRGVTSRGQQSKNQLNNEDLSLQLLKIFYVLKFFRNHTKIQVSPFSCECTAWLYVPGVVFDGAEREVSGDLCCTHTILHILLVGKYQHSCFPQVLKEVEGWNNETLTLQLKRLWWHHQCVDGFLMNVLPHVPTSCRAPL